MKAQVTQAIAEGHEPDNPVTRALGQQHLEQTASPELKVIADTLESLKGRIGMLEIRDFLAVPISETRYSLLYDPNRFTEKTPAFLSEINAIAPFEYILPAQPGVLLVVFKQPLTQDQIQKISVVHGLLALRPAPKPSGM